jgi:hypothetical protein
MDYRKEHNSWLTFYEHWHFLGMVLVMAVLLAILLPMVSCSYKTVKSVESDDFYGDLSTDTGSVYWNVLSEPGTNRVQFVLLLPVTTTIGSGSTNHPSYADDFCDLQVKSNGHQWKIANALDWKTGIQTVQLQDLTANTTSTLDLNNGRFWQLDDAGHATPLEKIDAATMDKILSQVKADQTNSAAVN